MQRRRHRRKVEGKDRRKGKERKGKERKGKEQKRDGKRKTRKERKGTERRADKKTDKFETAGQTDGQAYRCRTNELYSSV